MRPKEGTLPVRAAPASPPMRAPPMCSSRAPVYLVTERGDRSGRCQRRNSLHDAWKLLCAEMALRKFSKNQRLFVAANPPHELLQPWLATDLQG